MGCKSVEFRYIANSVFVRRRPKIFAYKTFLHRVRYADRSPVHIEISRLIVLKARFFNVIRYDPQLSVLRQVCRELSNPRCGGMGYVFDAGTLRI